jgi:hypothetical protein
MCRKMAVAHKAGIPDRRFVLFLTEKWDYCGFTEPKRSVTLFRMKPRVTRLPIQCVVRSYDAAVLVLKATRDKTRRCLLEE